MYLTTNIVKDSKPIAINVETGDIVRLTEEKENKKVEEPFEYLDNKDLRKHKKYMSVLDINRLQNALKKDIEPDDDLKELYGELKTKLQNKTSKEINIHNGEFMLLPTPKKTNRIYIAGSTGVGKSTWIANYLKQYTKIYGDRPIYLFSDAPNDPTLDNIKGLIRIVLNDKLVSKPIETMELADSVCIFDDVDSISNKKIKQAVLVLYDAILKKGSSKDNIELIVSSHAMSDYQATRNVLINCNYIVFFPQSPVGAQYTLKKFGLNKEQVQRLLSVPSRWCCFHKNYPFFAITTKSVFIL